MVGLKYGRLPAEVQYMAKVSNWPVCNSDEIFSTRRIKIEISLLEDNAEMYRLMPTICQLVSNRLCLSIPSRANVIYTSLPLIHLSEVLSGTSIYILYHVHSRVKLLCFSLMGSHSWIFVVQALL